MTVEAALILPMVILLFASLLGLMNLVRIFVVLDSAVQATIRDMAIYAYPMERITDFSGGIIEDPFRIVPKSIGADLASWAISTHLEKESAILERIQVKAVEFPQGEELFRQREASGDFVDYSEGFGCNDVFLAITYQPVWAEWFPGVDGGIVFQAMERGWVEGKGTLFAVENIERSIFKEEKETVYVYVTRTGVKYHREDCRYLAKSKIIMSLTEASKRYEGCKVCVPPVPGSG